ncbi:50S ribosomal protein L24 [Haloquadratum walsbyi]|jgi:large subunit ribosomal protein L24|uniref:Large ribosomal subunit protein uL24 n=1 Tax=Haloquadratum walsbyi (strain DSM 16790 / HBSQ001) TaxID=362976 RepID=RL24_HALWD|nr:50S ribosomal protein L24 [Haloquadratum walsbyi]Q18GG0.1 RecName: Full=Large ribosomal subunit protein uL24; AltName: Full=50S ribosomal protein L24 [Haloquadratum walsbyi DSM 16790]CAJ52938.1 50S ribosomal protein L24 [Haloquadratum walsbyi DSM 16790]
MSKQPRKQRTRTETAPLHERQRAVRATLSDELREEYGQRNVRVNAGDTVEVLRGDDAGHEAEVVTVDLTETVIHVEDVTIEKADGEEVPRPLDSSNLRVTELNLEDSKREARLEEGDEQ